MSLGAAVWTRRAATAAVLAGAGVVCAHWFWKFASPPPAAIGMALATPASRPLDGILAARLFGTPPTLPSVAAPVGAADLHLRGISSSRRGAMAVIAVDKGKTITATVGDEIIAGVKLERVRPDHVIVTRGGVPQRLDLPQRKPTDAAPIKPAPSAAQKR